VFDFAFETVTPTPITGISDPDYWLTNYPGLVQGLYSIDNAPAVTTDSAYGVDITVQQAYISPDWDMLAVAWV
jgi:hypothetical protein